MIVVVHKMRVQERECTSYTTLSPLRESLRTLSLPNDFACWRNFLLKISPMKQSTVSAEPLTLIALPHYLRMHEKSDFKQHIKGVLLANKTNLPRMSYDILKTENGLRGMQHES